MIEEGQTAPAFTLNDQDGKPRSLKDYRGQWVVLYFYPKDDTPGCTTQACEFTEGVQAFQNLGATVLGCSPDDAASHRAFIEKHKLKISLLSDETLAVMKAYGAYGEKNMYGKTTMGVIRSTVVIDPKGVIQKHWKKVNAAGHAEKVREWLAEHAEENA